MATAPPPYSRREQKRAQRDAARAQRYYWRSARRPSVTGPAALIVIGIIALLVEAGKLSMVRVWNWYVEWWPLLLIVVGLISLAEWYLDRDQPGIRRTHGGVIVLILLLAGLGYANHGLHGLGFLHGGDDDFMYHFLGQEHDDDQSLNEAIPPASRVDIQVPHGDVTVTTSSDEQIHVQTHQVVYAANDRDARRAFTALTPALSVAGSTVTLRVADQGNGHADLSIELPADATATVVSGRGDVTLQGLATPVNVTADRGDVHFEALRAGAHARMNKGDFTAHDITGDVTLEGHLEDVTISMIKGRVVLDGDFFGDTHLGQISAPVHFHSSRTDIELISVPGDVSLDSGDLHVEDAVGPARIATHAKDVQVHRVSGDLRIDDSDGEITASPIAPFGPISIHNGNGAINLELPENAGYQLQATARNGDLQSDFGIEVTGSGDGHSASGKLGAGGPTIDLVAEHGDIRITKADPSIVVPRVPALPALPAMPHGPGVPAIPAVPHAPAPPHVPHLRSSQEATTQTTVQ